MFWGDDAEEMLHWFESDLEQKSEIVRTEIWTKSVRKIQDFAPPPRKIQSFGKFGMLKNHISFRKICISVSIWIRFGNEMNQISVRNLFQIWWNFFGMPTPIKTEAPAWTGENVYSNVYANLNDFLKIPIRFGIEIWLNRFISVPNLIQICLIQQRFCEFWDRESLKKKY